MQPTQGGVGRESRGLMSNRGAASLASALRSNFAVQSNFLSPRRFGQFGSLFGAWAPQGRSEEEGRRGGGGGGDGEVGREVRGLKGEERGGRGGWGGGELAN